MLAYFREKYTGRVVETSPLIQGTRGDDVVCFCNIGGGFIHSLPTAEFNETFEPYHPNDAGIKPVKVTVGDIGVSFDAYAHDDHRWNGWLLPLMTLDQVKVFAEWVSANPDTLIRLTIEGDTVTCFDVEEAEKYDLPRKDGKYDVGLGWCWEIADVPDGGEPQELALWMVDFDGLIAIVSAYTQERAVDIAFEQMFGEERGLDVFHVERVNMPTGEAVVGTII